MDLIVIMSPIRESISQHFNNYLDEKIEERARVIKSSVTPSRQEDNP